MAGHSMIEAQGLSKVYEMTGENVRVLEGLNLCLPAAESLAITGPSGSGKTTLLNLLGALDTPSAGTLRIAGEDLTKMTPAAAARFRNRHLGFIFQQHALLPQLTVIENVLVPRLAGDWTEASEVTMERAKILLEKVGLTPRGGHFPWQLSGGEKLRVAVARALINEPRLVLADEPTGLLDPATAELVIDLLLHLQRELGVTLVVVTHHLALAGRLDRHLQLVNGQLIEP